MNYWQANLSNLLTECLEDSMSRRRAIFYNHNFFNQCFRLQVVFIPVSIISGNTKFKYVEHLIGIDKYWKLDISFLKDNTYGIRFVFDEDKVQDAFLTAQDCSLEVEILSDILTLANEMIQDIRFENIIEALQETKYGKPRFTIFAVEKPALFPELIDPFKPKNVHFKRAKKRIAELAEQLGVNEGEYALNNARITLNTLRDKLVDEINTEVSNYNFESTIPFLITRVDALSCDFERHRITVDHALGHDVDYQPEIEHAHEHMDFIKTHKNYRYLIEKFVQLIPDGKVIISKDQFQYLIALVDWLHVFYTASDHLHYGLYAVGMKINYDYLVEVVYEDDMEDKNKAFAEINSKIELGLIGKPNDRVTSPRPVEDFLDTLDMAFIIDLGFSYKTMVNVTQILSHWPSYESNVEESANYSATKEDIQDACLKAISRRCTSVEIGRVVDFLTLKTNEVIQIFGKDKFCSDIPVWEYRKRYARYNLKPLIKIENQYYWGPYSARNSGMIWTRISSDIKLPADLGAKNIDREIKIEKELIENALTDKAYEIVSRYTPYLKKNLELQNLNPKGLHPQDLGDYDVLSFHRSLNILICIECKDIYQPYCLKDTKRLREKIFGIPGKNRGHFDQIEKRIEYLKEHTLDICSSLKWPITEIVPPTVLSLYVTRRAYWWTQFPPVQVTTEFIRIDLLSDFIENLKQINTDM